MLIGPAGSPGAYSADVKVLVRREVDQKTAFEKTYKVEANTGGAAQAPFQIVTEPILLPLTRAKLNDDYSIFVGFDNGHNAAIERPRGKPQAGADELELTKSGAFGLFVVTSVQDTQRKSPARRIAVPAPKAQPPRKRSGQWTVG